MKEMTPHRVQVLQGNRTVRQVMVEALEASGFEVSREADDELADLLVIDVDSGLQAPEAHQARYDDDRRPVLVCGLRNSREHHPDVAWLQRPFSPDGFVAECRNLLGLGESDGFSEMGGLAEPYGLGEDSTPQTQRLTLEAAERLEEELGLEKGTLDLSHEDSEAEVDLSLDDTNNLGPDDAPEFLELETANSIELDVEDLEEVDVPSGGSLVGELEREALRVEELEWSTPVAEPPEVTRSATLNQTMPDAPAVMAPKEVTDDSAPHALPEPPLGDAGPPRAASGPQGGLQAALSANEAARLESQIEDVSQALAASWGRIGLAARARDRANHIRGVLHALFAEGTAASAAEIERIPNARGFSGDLAAMGLDDLLHTACARQLRGRLELSVGTDDFVLYLEGEKLVDLENLSGSDDELLLDILLELGAITPPKYEELARSMADELAAPVQMRLRQEALVSAQDLVLARKERVLRLCRDLLACRQGSFAFVAVDEGTGQAWPVDGLSIEIKDLLEAERREASDASAALRRAAPGHGRGRGFFPEGFETDAQLTPTIEVTDPDSEN